MSEFSESYHLRTLDKNEGRELTKKLGVRGIVFDETNGWVTVLPEGEMNSLVETVTENYDGTILHYMYAQDHAWMINLFNRGEPLSRFICAWDPEVHIENESLNLEELLKFLLNPKDRDEFEKLFSLTDFEDILEINPAYSFADLLGIEHYQWIAGHDIEIHGAELVENTQGAELIE